MYTVLKKIIKNSYKKILRKAQQNFKNVAIFKRYNVFTEEINEITLSLSDNERMQLTDSIGTYAYGTSKDLVCKKEETKCNNIVKIY